MIESKIINQITQRLSYPLPGRKVQFLMSPSHRANNNASFSQPIQSSVLILLYTDNNNIKFVLIKRAKDHTVHSQQISFPGGKYEKNDNQLFQTAIRETQEEIGINKDKIKYLGKLTPLYIPISNFQVYPFVGHFDAKPQFILNTQEVETIINIDIKDIIQPEIIKVKNQSIAHTKVIIPYFDINDVCIWGATAMILREFVEILKKI